jgi:hypothetical protein
LARKAQGKLGMILALACASPLTTGCLVADAPTYGPPQQRPPVINFDGVTPSPYDLLVIEPNTPAKTYQVPVRSEDAGELLVGTLIVDWQQPGSQITVDDREIPASSFDDVTRRYEAEWSPDPRVITPGCLHTLTALIMHKSNFDGVNDVPKPNVQWDVASVTWQLNVVSDPEQGEVITVCPGVGPGMN